MYVYINVFILTYIYVFNGSSQMDMSEGPAGGKKKKKEHYAVKHKWVSILYLHWRTDTFFILPAHARILRTLADWSIKGTRVDPFSHPSPSPPSPNPNPNPNVPSHSVTPSMWVCDLSFVQAKKDRVNRDPDPYGIRCQLGFRVGVQG